MQFDCSLSLTKPQQDAIKDQLQEQVDKRHQGEDPNQRPKVELAPVQVVAKVLLLE